MWGNDEGIIIKPECCNAERQSKFFIKVEVHFLILEQLDDKNYRLSRPSTSCQHWYFTSKPTSGVTWSFFRGGGLCRPFMVGPWMTKLPHFFASCLIRPSAFSARHEHAHMQTAVTNWQVTVTATAQNKTGFCIICIAAYAYFSYVLELFCIRKLCYFFTRRREPLRADRPLAHCKTCIIPCYSTPSSIYQWWIIVIFVTN